MKPSVKSLSEEVDQLKEQMEDYHDMKNKVFELETKLNALEKVRFKRRRKE